MSKPPRSLSELDVVILAGGLGTRLQTAVPNRQKVLAEIGKRPFICFVLDQLVRYGACRLILCVGYKAGQVQEYFGDTYQGLDLRYSLEEKPLDTAGALRLALPLIESSAVMVMNGDSICEVDLTEFYRWHQAHDTQGSLAVVKVPDSGRYGSVQLDDSGRVAAFMEKGPIVQDGWINAGIYLLARDWLNEIPDGKPVSLERTMFPRWIERRLMGYRVYGRFIDIGIPESYARAEKLFGAVQGNGAS